MIEQEEMMNKFKEGQFLKIKDMIFTSSLFINGDKDRIWEVVNVLSGLIDEKKFYHYFIKSEDYLTTVPEEYLIDPSETSNNKIRTSDEILTTLKIFAKHPKNKEEPSINISLLIDYIEKKI